MEWALLRRYRDERSEEAFAALVSRRLDMVYAICLREIGNAALAEDAAQSVFISLAAKAVRLSAGAHIAGWLFRAARLAARTVRTRETRRMRYEHEATRTANPGNNARSDPRSGIKPLLTEAVGKLSGSDREAILPRYFDGLRPAEVGASLTALSMPARRRWSDGSRCAPRMPLRRRSRQASSRMRHAGRDRTR